MILEHSLAANQIENNCFIASSIVNQRVNFSHRFRHTMPCHATHTGVVGRSELSSKNNSELQIVTKPRHEHAYKMCVECPVSDDWAGV